MNDFAGPDKVSAIDSLISKYNQENENLYYTFNPFKYIVLTNYKDKLDIVKNTTTIYLNFNLQVRINSTKFTSTKIYLRLLKTLLYTTHLATLTSLL